MHRASLVAALCMLGVAHGEVVDPAASYPEGALWLDAAMLYTEMGADQVSTVSGGAKPVYWREQNCGPTSLAPHGDGGLLVLCHIGVQIVALDADAHVVRRWRSDVRPRSLSATDSEHTSTLPENPPTRGLPTLQPSK